MRSSSQTGSKSAKHKFITCYHFSGKHLWPAKSQCPSTKCFRSESPAWSEPIPTRISSATIHSRGRDSSYLLAYQLHFSGIIATLSAGLIVGNLGTRDCSSQTKTALESFWAYLAFIMNSLVFLLIGLEIHVDALLRSWRPVLLTVGAVLVGRALSVYVLVPVSNALTEKISLRWQHVIVWGGLRGALALALALSLDNTFPDRTRVLDLTFGVVVFSILVQGLTVKPLLRVLRLANGQG
jgi:NhaP-type Na+/H+ or K+/H+ antiporter